MAKEKMKFSSFLLYLVLLFTISLNFVLSSAIPMDSTVHMVYMEQPRNEELKAYYIRTLASVLGSEEAARKALVYTYKNAACGFAAQLTPDQVKQISKQRGVLGVAQSHEIPLD